MKEFEFKVFLIGKGDTAEEAWADATEAFCADTGEPESWTEEELEED